MMDEEEKQEWLRVAKSSDLRSDQRELDRLNDRREDSSTSDVDAYLQFVSLANSFCNHAGRAFQKITGEHFKL